MTFLQQLMDDHAVLLCMDADCDTYMYINRHNNGWRVTGYDAGWWLLTSGDIGIDLENAKDWLKTTQLDGTSWDPIPEAEASDVEMKVIINEHGDVLYYDQEFDGIEEHFMWCVA